MIIVLLADGFEEIEALTPLDMLRRCGLNVKTVGVTSKIAVGSHGISVVCDLMPDEVPLDEITMAIFPGGMPGSLNLDASPFTDRVIDAVKRNGGRLAAICAAPLVFGRRGLLEGRLATCYPGFEKELRGAKTVDAGVVTDGDITTARGMGVALEFSLELIAQTLGEEKAAELSDGVMRAYSYDRYSVIREENVSKACDQSLIDAATDDEEARRELREVADGIVDTLTMFGIGATIKGVIRGPRISTFEIVPAKGVKVARILNLADDIALNLAVNGLRMVAPIPGKSAIGVEIPNRIPTTVWLSELTESEDFKAAKSNTLACIGRNVAGDPVFIDVAKMPHAIIAGAAGMGKSICIDSIIVSLLLKASPEELGLILVDTKRTELTPFATIPHLLTPIIDDAKIAVGALKWATAEMERRYAALEKAGVRNLAAYNEAVANDPSVGAPMKRIVIIIDELADIMRTHDADAERYIVYLAQKARAAGIHLIISTQSPTTGVLTGAIRANIPTRICLRLTSNINSRLVLDTGGAEKLLSKGDMLVMLPSSMTPIRVQGSYIKESEISDLVGGGCTPVGDRVITAEINREAESLAKKKVKPVEDSYEGSEPEGYLNNRQFLDAVDVAIAAGKVSTSLLQRRLSIGYGKAAKYIDVMEMLGIITPADGQRPRLVLRSAEEWKALTSRLNKSEDEPVADTAVTEKKDDDVRARDNELIEEVTKLANKTVDFFADKRIDVSISRIERGHAVSVFELESDAEAKELISLDDGLAKVLEVEKVRFSITAAGKLILEVPNREKEALSLSEMLNSFEFVNAPKSTTFCVGMSTERTPIFADIARSGNLFVGGGVGSGVSTVLANIALSIATKASADKVKLMLLDPRGYELTHLGELPHLYMPIATTADEIRAALEKAVELMDERFERLQEADVRSIEDYNEHMAHMNLGETMPRLIIIADEYTNLVEANRGEIEALLTALCAKGRAAGIHVVISSSRVSAAKMPSALLASVASRICLATPYDSESKPVIGIGDGTRLVRYGDALYCAMGASVPVRVYVPYVSRDEAERMAGALKNDD